MARKYDKFQLPDGPVALANSGGGSKGAYELGHLQYLIEVKKFRDFKVIYGTSTGSLISALFAYWVITGDAHHFYDLVNIYSNVHTDDIITPRNKLVHSIGGDEAQLLASLLTGENSIYETEPLENIVDRFMTESVWNELIGAAHQSKNPLEVGFVISCLESGEGRVVSTRNCHEPRELRNALVASANQPVFTPTVDVFDDGETWVDGGLTDYIPIEYVFKSDFYQDIEAILALSLDQPGPTYKEVENKIGAITLRTLDLLIDQVHDADMRSAHFLNFIAKVKEVATREQWRELKQVLPLAIQREAQKLGKSVPIFHMFPKRPFNTDGLVFEPKQMRSWIRQGFREAASWYA